MRGTYAFLITVNRDNSVVGDESEARSGQVSRRGLTLN